MLHHVFLVSVVDCADLCTINQVLGFMKSILSELGLWDAMGLALRATLLVGAGLYVYRQFRGGS